MNKELEEAKQNLINQLENTKIANECGLATKGEFSKDIKTIETVLNYIDNSISKEEYNKIKEENEILKQEKRSRIIGKYGEIEVHDLIKQTLSKDFISKEAIKEKIKKLEKYKDITPYGIGKLEGLYELLEGK